MMFDENLKFEPRNIVISTYKHDKIYNIFFRVDDTKLFSGFGVVGVVLENELITDIPSYINEIKTRKRFSNGPILQWISFYSLFSKEYSNQIITAFFQKRLSFLKNIKVINEIELLLKLRTFFFLRDNYNSKFNLLNPDIKPLKFRVDFLYASPGNSIKHDNSIKYFDNKNLKLKDRYSSLCFQYRIFFYGEEESEEVVKLTVINLQMLSQTIPELLKNSDSEILTFPPFVLMQKMDIDKINKDFFELIKDEKIDLAGSKHEVMLHFARLTKIENLDYWLNMPMDKKYLHNYYYDILSTKYDFNKPEGL